MRKYILLLLILSQLSCNPLNINLSKIKVKDWKGQSIDWKQYEGKTLIVHFWASWCKDCLKEMPFWVQTKQDLGADSSKVAFVFISDEDTAKVIPFVKERGYHFDFVQLQGTLKDVDIIYIPQTFVFDKKGKALASFGSHKWSAEEMRKWTE